ncbi:hypothetical protein F5Y05DRAFT_411798 [Hypoxylon sp. FL0543]|nr:hypothetical protein F5Y05DRAFT_411798 [Hypoxylon sp. FL0543]
MGTILAPSEVRRMLRDRLSPHGWSFYITTRIDGALRPLAGGEQTTRNFGDPRNEHNRLAGRQAVLSCLKVLNILSDSANRRALEAERTMAAEYYRGGLKTHEALRARVPTGESVREFPFTETCLWLGTTQGLPNRILVRDLPLREVHRYGQKGDRGVIFFDVTDLDKLRYCITSPKNSPEPRKEDLGLIEVDNDLKEATRELKRFPIMDRANIDLTWLPRIPTRGPYKAPNSLCHQALRELINSTLEFESFDMSIFAAPRCVPRFKRLLQECLYGHSNLNNTRSVGQLIALAFEGDTHLDLVRFKVFPTKTIGFALQTEELSGVRSISIRTGLTRDSIMEVIDAVSHAPSLRELYLHQSPTRKNDEANFAFIKILSTRPELFKRVKVVFSSAFSVTLNRELWLNPESTPDCEPPPDIFPVQNVFFLLRGRTRYPTHIYLGNGLLSAEAFVARLLRCLSLPGLGSFGLAAGPSSLEDLSRLEVTPISVFSDNRIPKPRSWTVLVIEGSGVDEDGHLCKLPQAKAIKYAFVRLCVDSYDGCLDDWTQEFALKLEQIEVADFKGFLKITAPDVDSALVDRRLAETVEAVANREGNPHAAPGVEWISVLIHNEACTFLNHFLNEIRVSVWPRVQ